MVPKSTLNNCRSLRMFGSLCFHGSVTMFGYSRMGGYMAKQNKAGGVTTASLLESMKALFFDKKRQMEEVEKIVHAVAKKYDDASTFMWVKVYTSYLEDFQTFESIDCLKKLYWSLPQFGPMEEEMGLPNTKKWILEKVIEYCPAYSTNVEIAILQFFAAAHTPDPRSLTFIQRLPDETEDDICARGRCGNREEKRLVEQILRAYLENTLDWKNIESLMTAVRLPEELLKILAHAWIRSGASLRLEQVLHNDRAFVALKGTKISDHALMLLGKYVVMVAQLERSALELKQLLMAELYKIEQQPIQIQFCPEDIDQITFDVRCELRDGWARIPDTIKSTVRQWQKQQDREKIRVYMCASLKVDDSSPLKSILAEWI